MGGAARRPARLDALAGMLTLLFAPHARASCPVIETHTGARPPQADDRLRPMFEVFDARGCLSRRALTEALADDSRAGISISEAELQSLGAHVDSGINLLRREDLTRATEQFQRAIAIARGASAALARDHSLRTTALRAYVGLALAFKRWGERLQLAGDREGAARAFADAERWMAEGVRSFPGMEPDRLRGKEAVTWWREVRERQLASPTGTLVVDPGDDGASVFLQESYLGRGLTTKTGLPPGTYRVYTERAEVSGRVHPVEVRAGEDTRLVLDWSLDSTLRTGAWVGFEYETPADHQARRSADAGRLATLLHEPYAIVIGLASRDHDRYAFGLTVTPRGKVLVAGQVTLDARADEAALLRHLALALTLRDPAAGLVLVPGVEALDLSAAPLPWAERPLGLARVDLEQARWRWISQLTIGVGALGAATSGLVYLMSPDDDHTSSMYADRKTPAVGVFVGSSVVIGTGVFLYLHESRSLGVTTAALLGAGAAALLSGAMLIATDEDPYAGVGTQRMTFRDSAVPGWLLGGAGAALMGAGIWRWTLDRSGTRLPLVRLERGGGILGWTGDF